LHSKSRNRKYQGRDGSVLSRFAGSEMMRALGSESGAIDASSSAALYGINGRPFWQGL
jgi:hypothetical protein